MKLLDRCIIIIFTLCLIISSVLIPINVIITSDVYYQNQFKKCGIAPVGNGTVSVRYIGGDITKTAELTNEQLETIISHITAYLANQKDSFVLKMDEVKVNGETVDGVDIFGNEAVTHMDNVKQLFGTLKIVLTVCIVMITICAIYMLIRKANIKKVIFKYSLGTVLGFWGAVSLLFIFVFIKLLISSKSISANNYFTLLWSYMHYIFFPFDSEKFMGSFFDDTLTQILTPTFFMNTVSIIVSNIIALTTAWLVSAKLIFKK